MLKRTLVLFLAISTIEAQSLVIRAGTVLDGKGGLLRNRYIVVENGRIVEVTTVKRPITYDLSRYTVMPGWIDTHVHLSGHFSANSLGGGGSNRGSAPRVAGPTSGAPAIRGAGARESDQEVALYTAGNAYTTLLAGFTTVQSLGSAVDAPVRDLINAGILPGPRILTALRSIRVNTGTPGQIREEIRRLKAEGADVVKVYATESIRTGGGPSMTAEQIQAACSEARAVGLRSVVHAQVASGAKTAALAGCTQVEHGSLIDDEALKLIAEHKVFFDPTFTVFHRYLETRSHFNYNAEGAGWMEKGAALEAEAVKKALALKVRIVLGSDANAGVHGYNADEFVYRVKEGGQSPMDAIISGTSLAAESLGLQDRIGFVGEGLEADLVAIDGNPLVDITAVRQVVFVMKGGKVYKNSSKKP